MLFERFEVLGSLAHFEGNSKSETHKTLASPDRQSRVWVPVGRSGWHEGTAAKLISELQSESEKANLLKAGFAKGDAEFMDLFITNFRRIASYMSWM